jgi:hypothetical protein
MLRGNLRLNRLPLSLRTLRRLLRNECLQDAGLYARVRFFFLFSEMYARILPMREYSYCTKCLVLFQMTEINQAVSF